jgi:hypothetical protein
VIGACPLTQLEIALQELISLSPAIGESTTVLDEELLGSSPGRCG